MRLNFSLFHTVYCGKTKKLSTLTEFFSFDIFCLKTLLSRDFGKTVCFLFF